MYRDAHDQNKRLVYTYCVWGTRFEKWSSFFRDLVWRMFERAVKYDQDAGTIASGHLPSWSSDGEVRKPSFYHFSKETCPPE